MTHQDPNTGAASADARHVAQAIEGGWIGRGFKLGIGFFLAGLVIWMIPILLLASCVGGLAAMAGGAALSAADGKWEFHTDVDEGDPVDAPAPTSLDTADAAAAAEAAVADTAAARTEDR